MKNFNRIYRSILCDVEYAGLYEVNRRTNEIIKISRLPLFFTFDMSPGWLPVPGNRTVWPRVAAAETAWQILGTQSPEFINKFAPKIWSKFVEDGIIKTAYGHRWRHQFGRDQLSLAVAALKTDKTNRQIFISAWDPSCDGLGQPNQPKNIPCPVGFSLNIIGDKLNCTVFMRSSDIFVGLPYDVMNYAMLAQLIANELGIGCSCLSFTLAHAHYYSQHEKYVKTSINDFTTWQNLKFAVPKLTLSQVEKNPEALVDYYKAIPVENFWDPAPNVVE